MKKKNLVWFALAMAGVVLNMIVMLQTGITFTNSANMVLLSILCYAFFQ